jgi:predicted ATP-dependent serine protease
MKKCTVCGSEHSRQNGLCYPCNKDYNYLRNHHLRYVETGEKDLEALRRLKSISPDRNNWPATEAFSSGRYNPS